MLIGENTQESLGVIDMLEGIAILENIVLTQDPGE